MSALKWIVAGVMGGLFGAGIWGLVGYYSGYEVGWIAWGIGIIVGLAVRAAAGTQDGFAPGVAATIIAIGAVLLGKYLVVSWSLSGWSEEVAQVDFTADNVIASFANEIALKREADGQPVSWPENVAEDAPIAANFPPELWAEAEKRWSGLQPDEQQALIAERKKEFQGYLAELGGSLQESAFRDSFAAWDLLWLGLASFTAFKLGSGMESGE